MIVWASWYMLNLKNSSGAREGWGQGDVRGDTCITTALSEDSAKSRYFALRPSIKSIVYLS